MARITVAAMNDALATTLSAAATLMVTQTYHELTEGIADFPLLQVYPEAWGPGRTGPTHAITGRGGVRKTEWVFHADYYASTRSIIGEDMAALLAGIDAMEAVLEAQQVKPYFGLAEIESFTWEGTRVVFQYGDDGFQQYMGCRYVIPLIVF